MLPDGSLAQAESAALEFDVLSDVGNDVARAYGLAFRLDDRLRDLYEHSFAIDLEAYNGPGGWELPVPGTFVVAPGGTVLLAYAEPDYTQRLEPDTILAALARG